SDLAPDWLRIGTDIIGGTTPPTFNMTFSLAGLTLPKAKPGRPNCHGESVSTLAEQFQGLDAAASSLGFSSVDALQDALRRSARNDASAALARVRATTRSGATCVPRA